jgi:hypothetical protein
MKITKSQLKEIIKEELLQEFGGVGNFGGKAGQLGAAAGRGQEIDSPDREPYGPEQNAEDGFISILIQLGRILDEWQEKEYRTDEIRYKSYFKDIQDLLVQYDPCAHRGEKCDDAHPEQTHEECIQVTINDGLQEGKKKMPSEKSLKKAENSMKKTAKKKFPGDKEQQDRYVYGGKRKMGWKPKKER